jgi:hypothetical protein
LSLESPSLHSWASPESVHLDNSVHDLVICIESPLTHSKHSLHVQHSFKVIYQVRFAPLSRLHLADPKVGRRPPPTTPSSSFPPPSSPSQLSSNLSHAPPPFAPNALPLPSSPLLYLLLLACWALCFVSCWSSSRWILAPHCSLLLISAGKADRGGDGLGEDTVNGGLLPLWRWRRDLFWGWETIWSLYSCCYWSL